MNSITAADIAQLSDAKLEELDSRLDRLCWTMSSPAYQARGAWAEDIIALIEDEKSRRGTL